MEATTTTTTQHEILRMGISCYQCLVYQTVMPLFGFHLALQYDE